MTHTKDEALKLALEAHQAMREWIDAVPDDTVLPTMPGCDRDWLDTVEAAIKQALAAPVQEPVGVTTGCASHEGFFTVVFRAQQPIPDGTGLYTTPPAAPVPLTEPALRAVLEKTNHMIANTMRGPFWPELEQACRAIEAAHGITAAPEKGQP
jgi:hypothetical protein